MYTICWREPCLRSGWDEVDSRDEAIELISSLISECCVKEEEIFIFPPAAHEMRMSYNEFMEDAGHG